MFDDNGSFLLALFEFFLFFAWFMCLWWVLSDIFRSKDIGGGVKTLWVLFVIFIPWLGILVYLVARGHGMQERQIEQAKDMQEAQSDYIQSVAPPTCHRPDRVRQGTSRQRGNLPGGVRPDQGEGARPLICKRRVMRTERFELNCPDSLVPPVNRPCSPYDNAWFGPKAVAAVVG